MYFSIHNITMEPSFSQKYSLCIIKFKFVTNLTNFGSITREKKTSHIKK